MALLIHITLLRPRPRRWLAALLPLAALATFASAAIPTATPAGAAETNREYEVKAAALYNIIAFIDWPAEALASPEAPLVIGVLGQGPVTRLLGDFVAGETWHGHRIVLRQLATPAEAGGCNVLYIGRSEQSRWPLIRTQLGTRPVLTVSDADNFAREGGIVQLAIERHKLRLIVNLGAAHTGGLKISSKVLRLAEVLGENSE